MLLLEKDSFVTNFNRYIRLQFVNRVRSRVTEAQHLAI